MSLFGVRGGEIPTIRCIRIADHPSRRCDPIIGEWGTCGQRDHLMSGHASQREVIQTDALTWLAANPAAPGSSVITSLPDVSELSHLTFSEWQTWFMETARVILRWIPEAGVAIFYQSDIRHEGVWIDKGFLISKAAESVGANIVWHKIVCRKPPGTIAVGRPSYSHMICVSQIPRPTPIRPGPDVIADAGFMSWSRAMGENACRVACRFLRDEVKATTVVDPFCGRGSVLAVANNLGLASIGIDLSAKRCRAARKATTQTD